MSTAQHMPTEAKLLYLWWPPLPASMPYSAGLWMWTELKPVSPHILERQLPRPVLVTETPAAGRLCRELRMGGSAHCGLAPWIGQWERVREAA